MVPRGWIATRRGFGHALLTRQEALWARFFLNPKKEREPLNQGRPERRIPVNNPWVVYGPRSGAGSLCPHRRQYCPPAPPLRFGARRKDPRDARRSPTTANPASPSALLTLGTARRRLPFEPPRFLPVLREGSPTPLPTVHDGPPLALAFLLPLYLSLKGSLGPVCMG